MKAPGTTPPAGAVTIENESTPPPTIGNGANLVFAPVCARVDLPEYPSDALQYRLPPVRVRVDLVVGEDGRATRVRATALDPTAHDESFKAEAIRTVSAWECEPAWRISGDDSEPFGRIFLAYPAHVIFRFFVDESGKSAVAKEVD